MPPKKEQTPDTISATIAPRANEMIDELKVLYRGNRSAAIEAAIRMLYSKEKKKVAEFMAL